MNEYDKTFNPDILIGHYDLLSWFSDFALYLNTEWVYEAKKKECNMPEKNGSIGIFFFLRVALPCKNFPF